MGADRPDGGRISGFEMTFSDGTDQGSALTESQLSLPGDAVLSTPTPGSGPTGYCEVVTGTSTDLGQELTSVRLSTSSGSMTDSAGNFTIMLTTPADFATRTIRRMLAAPSSTPSHLKKVTRATQVSREGFWRSYGLSGRARSDAESPSVHLPAGHAIAHRSRVDQRWLRLPLRRPSPGTRNRRGTAVGLGANTK